MKNVFILFLMGLSLAGCSNGFSGLGSSAASDVLEGCGGCDVSGAGGSLKLMQTDSQITVSSISSFAATTIPDGVWSTGCVPNSDNSGSTEGFLTVNVTDARWVTRVYRALGCGSPDLDDVQILRYTFQSLGTATDMVGGVAANKLYSGLMQINHEPHSSAVASQIVSMCQTAGLYQGNGDVVYDGSKSYDTSSCDNGSLVVGSNDLTTRFYTNGSVLKLGTINGLATYPSVGYLTK